MKPYYQDDFITLYHGDWRDVPVTGADLVLADPPYGIGLKTEYASRARATRARNWPRVEGELDALVAEKVMGIQIFNGADPRLPPVWIEEHTGASVAYYSTEIADAPEKSGPTIPLKETTEIEEQRMTTRGGTVNSKFKIQPARPILMSDLADAYISGANDGRCYPDADAERAADGYVKLFITSTHDGA